MQKCMLNMVKYQSLRIKQHSGGDSANSICFTREVLDVSKSASMGLRMKRSKHTISFFSLDEDFLWITECFWKSRMSNKKYQKSRHVRPAGTQGRALCKLYQSVDLRECIYSLLSALAWSCQMGNTTWNSMLNVLKS